MKQENSCFRGGLYVLMIRFCCQQCGKRLSVPDQSAGRRGKCPKCGSVVIVPDKIATIVLHCGNCGRKITVPNIHAGKKGRCPNCKNPVVVPEVKEPVYVQKKDDPADTATRLVGNDIGLALLEILGELKLKDMSIVESGATEATIENEFIKESEAEEAKTAGQRNLPWFIDLLLYPVSRGGLSTIGVVFLLKLFIDIAMIFLACCCLGGIPGLIAKMVFVYAYIYWYFSECIRDSAAGSLRAPEIIGSMPGPGEMCWQLFRIFACYAFFLGPVTFYRGYTFFYKIETNNFLFWSLLTYGIFFFPMGILAIVMFNSINGLNPLLLIRSIFGVLIRYCLLVLLFYVFGILFVILLIKIASILPMRGIITSIFAIYIPFIFSVYALLVMGHLLGQFYYKYQDRLNWEV